MSDGPAAPESILDIFLQPGDLYWGAENTRLRTILGSCVAISIWHPANHTGGLCHYLLPRGGHSAKFAEGAMRAFLIEMRRAGADPSEYVAKVFGGANMFASPNGKNAPLHLGHANVEAAYSLLQQAGIRVVASDTGGIGYRKLIFELWTGHVWIRRQEREKTNGGAA